MLWWLLIERIIVRFARRLHATASKQCDQFIFKVWRFFFCSPPTNVFMSIEKCSWLWFGQLRPKFRIKSTLPHRFAFCYFQSSHENVSVLLWYLVRALPLCWDVNSRFTRAARRNDGSRASRVERQLACARTEGHRERAKKSNGEPRWEEKNHRREILGLWPIFMTIWACSQNTDAACITNIHAALLSFSRRPHLLRVARARACVCAALMNKWVCFEGKKSRNGLWTSQCSTFSWKHSQTGFFFHSLRTASRLSDTNKEVANKQAPNGERERATIAVCE